jgi:enoyl-CoA hydratase
MTETSSASGKLKIHTDGPVTTLTLNRPEAHNALDRELSQDLNDALHAINHDRSCRVLVITGAGETFCAGDDIKEFQTWTEEDPAWQVRLYQETVTVLENLVPVTISVVDGVCTGGGLELTLATDFVLATPRSRWGMPEVNWDITPGWGGTAKIAKYAGRRKAKEWNLLGTLFSGTKAERYDLVNRLVEPDEMDAELDHLIQIILSKDPTTMVCTKYFIDKGADLDYGSVLAFEGTPQRKPLQNQGVKDFAERESRDQRRALLDGFWFD